MPHLCQRGSRGKASGTSANHRNLLAGGGPRIETRISARPTSHRYNCCLNARNVDRAVKALTGAGGHAESIRAHQTADSAQRIAAEYLGSRSLEV
jgi:hypothetical protein